MKIPILAISMLSFEVMIMNTIVKNHFNYKRVSRNENTKQILYLIVTIIINNLYDSNATYA